MKEKKDLELQVEMLKEMIKMLCEGLDQDSGVRRADYEKICSEEEVMKRLKKKWDRKFERDVKAELS